MSQPKDYDKELANRATRDTKRLEEEEEKHRDEPERTCLGCGGRSRAVRPYGGLVGSVGYCPSCGPPF